MDVLRLDRAWVFLVGVVLTGCTLSTEGLDYKSGAGGGSSTSTSTSGSSASGSSSSVSSSASSAGGGAAPTTCASGFECVPKVAKGTYARKAPAASEACPAGWMPEGNVSDGMDPGCAGCSCDPPADGGCLSGNLRRWGSNGCDQEAVSPVPTNVPCVDVGTGASGYALDPSIVNQGTCVPSAGAKVPLIEASLCSFDGVSGSPCGEGGVCVPIGGGGFGDVCNLLTAPADCEPGWDAKELIYGGSNDTRVCSCQCGIAAGGSCSDATATVHAGDVCGGGALLTFTEGDGCTNGSSVDSGSSVKVIAGAFSPGMCAASPMKTGQVSFKNALVLCCPM